MQTNGAVLGVLAVIGCVSVLAFCHCLLAIFWPRAAWYLQEGWKFKGAQPSTASLVMTRFGGGFGLIVIGLFFALLIHSARNSNPPSIPAGVSSHSPDSLPPR
jgi:hypothetical protein